MNNSNDNLTNQFLNESYIIPDEGDVSDDSSTDNNSKHLLLREQDRFLPICNIVKIMKRAIPDNGKIAKDARECIQECVSEFISFITSEAIDRSHSENRKTVNGDDLLYAMAALGFDNYVDPLTLYLHKYRESTKSDRNLFYSDDVYLTNSSNDFSKTQNGVTSITPTADDSILYYQSNQPGNFNL